ncbi:MAG TPA: formimidoylglutamate deiminase [Solirubrobacteraceae bacterium]
MTRPFAIPAMPNVHSHAFQRALRGVGERPAPAARAADDFWSWREAMYALAASLDPDSMYAAGLRAYAEMAAAGYGVVGEFHYVHHQPDGTPYEDPNALAVALAEAARDAGLPIVLLPAAYHRAGWDGRDLPPTAGQRRFCDADVEAFLGRVDALRAWAAGRDGVHVGVAAHSVRAVPAAWLSAIARYAHEHDLVRHVHAHEQRREIDECLAEHGCTPIELLERTGFLSARTTLVHGVHVTPRDVALLAESDTVVATCPTTEGNLGDGHLPALAYRDAGVTLAIGSDQNTIVDPFEEVRELETLARRERQTRHALLAATGDLWGAVAAAGRRSLGLDAEAVGGIAVDLDHPRLAGVPEEDALRAIATCAGADVVVGPVARPPDP